MALWSQAYQLSRSDVTISIAATGSGAGISQALAGSAEIGASDAYLSNAQARNAMNVPLAVSAQVVAYNIQQIGDRHLNLSGEVLAAIYSGDIAFWDDPRIKAINPELGADLPHSSIVPIRRSDQSGDTFMFTQYLSRSSPSWKAGFGTSIAWPKASADEAVRGNNGMVDDCAKTEGSIAYIAVSYLQQIGFDGLGYAKLKARDGAYLLPTNETMQSAVSSATVPADARVSLIDRPGGDAYPIVSYEYAIVRPHQANSQQAEALRSFLDWAIDPAGGNDEARFLSALNFVALPAGTRAISKELIDRIR